MGDFFLLLIYQSRNPDGLTNNKGRLSVTICSHFLLLTYSYCILKDLNLRLRTKHPIHFYNCFTDYSSQLSFAVLENSSHYYRISRRNWTSTWLSNSTLICFLIFQSFPYLSYRRFNDYCFKILHLRFIVLEN